MSKKLKKSCCLKCGEGPAEKYHQFPTDPVRRQLWLQNCRRFRPAFTPTYSQLLCSYHFDDAQYESHRSDGVRKLRPDAVPMVFKLPSAASAGVVPCVSVQDNKKKRKLDDHQYSKHLQQLVLNSSSLNTDSSVPNLLSDDQNAPLTTEHQYSKHLQQLVLNSSSLSTDSSVPNLLSDDQNAPLCNDSLLTTSGDAATAHDGNKVKELMLEIRRLKLQLKQSQEREANLAANIGTFLNTDQIAKLMQPPGSKGYCLTWSSQTIQRCLAIRSVVGRNGYEYLRTLKYPLPSYRTLCRRIQNVPFAPGIQHDVLQWLRLKMDNKSECDKLCVLLIDEMQLKIQFEEDKGLHHIVGAVSPETLPADAPPEAQKEAASHALVFMLRGLTSSWKQTVAYLFTGTSIKREPFWAFTKRVIEASEAAGLKVQCITSDMGPSNTALWNEVGIKSTRTQVVPSIPHPCSTDRELGFIADPPHLLKNLWNCVLTHRITLGPQTIQKYNLQCDFVSGTYVNQLIDAQNCCELRMAYKLKEVHVSPTQYQKMRVCYAAQFFSRSTAAALQTAVRADKLPVEALTTAWFLSFVNDWFDAINARYKAAALFHGKDTAGKQALVDMLEIIQDLSFDGKKTWKPIQTGIQLSTTVALQLSERVMADYKLQYFLTGRLTQDPVENLFSQARGQGVQHPSCAMFRQALRLVTIAQYLQVAKGSAYEDDGCTYLIDYLKDMKQGGSIDFIDEENVLSALLEASDKTGEVDGKVNETQGNQLWSGGNEPCGIISCKGHVCETRTACGVRGVSQVGIQDKCQSSAGLWCRDDCQHGMSQAGDWQCQVGRTGNHVGEGVQCTSGRCKQPGLANFELQTDLWSLDESLHDELPETGEVEMAEITVSTAANSQRIPLQCIDNMIRQPLTCLEGNALYDLMGWAMFKYFQKVDCAECRAAFMTNDVSDQSLGQYTAARSYGGLHHPSQQLLAAGKVAEQVFIDAKSAVHQLQNTALEITKKVLTVLGTINFHFPDCHDALQAIMKRYIKLRINEHARLLTAASKPLKKQYGSKTALRSTLIP